MPADGQATGFDPFVTDTPAKPATQTVMIADRHGHSANLRVRIDPGVQAQMNKMISLRQCEYESVAEMCARSSARDSRRWPPRPATSS